MISRLKTRKSYEKIHDDDALISRTVLSMTPTSKSQEIIENCSNNQQQQILHNSECPVYVIWPKRNLLLLTTNITNGDVGLPFKLDENIIFDALPREINPNQSVVWFVDPATKMDESMINKFIRKYMYDIQENDFDGLISLLSVMKNGFNHYTLLELESVEYSELNDEYKQYDGYLKYVLNLKDIYSQKKECELSQEHEKEIENILQTTLKDYNEDNELRSGSYETKGVITNDQTDNYAKDIFLSQYNRVSLKYHPEDDLNQILERLIFEAQTATLIDHREIIGFSQEILKQYDLNIQYDAMRTFHQIVSKPADIYTKSDNYRELFNYCLFDDQEISKSCKSYLIKQNATSYNTHNILVKGYKFKENYQELINDYKHDESTQF